jgi:hypothetical protein
MQSSCMFRQPTSGFYVSPPHWAYDTAPMSNAAPAARSRSAGAKRKKANAKKASTKHSKSKAVSKPLTLARTPLAELKKDVANMLAHGYELPIILQWMMNHKASLRHLDALAEHFRKPHSSKSRSRSHSASRSRSRSRSTGLAGKVRKISKPLAKRRPAKH